MRKLLTRDKEVVGRDELRAARSVEHAVDVDEGEHAAGALHRRAEEVCQLPRELVVEDPAGDASLGHRVGNAHPEEERVEPLPFSVGRGAEPRRGRTVSVCV